MTIPTLVVLRVLIINPYPVFLGTLMGMSVNELRNDRVRGAQRLCERRLALATQHQREVRVAVSETKVNTLLYNVVLFIKDLEHSMRPVECVGLARSSSRSKPGQKTKALGMKSKSWFGECHAAGNLRVQLLENVREPKAFRRTCFGVEYKH